MKTKYFIHLSLKSKLMFLFSSLLLLVSAFIFIYIPAKREAFSVKAIEDKAQVIGLMTSYSISPAIVFDDKTAVEESFDNARQNNELLYLIVVVADGQIFKSYNLHKAIDVNYKKICVDFDLSVVKTEIPIYHQSNNIGSLFIGLSLNDVKKEIIETRITIGIISIIVFLFGLAAVIGISTFLTKPLYNFIGTIKEISSGDLGKRVMISTRDEIGLLANSFNEMLQKLQLAYEELGNLNKSLEDRVIERTRELKLSQERYKTLYENSPVMLHSIDNQGRLISVSEFWLSNTGYAREDVIGKKSVDFFTKESREYAERVILPDFLKSGYCKDILYQMVKKNGEFIDILLSATSEKDNEGNVLRSLAVLVDITEKKKAEKQLLESEERFRSLYENATLGIYRTTPDGKIEMANPALVEMLGHSSFEELAARDLEKEGFNPSYERKYFIEQIEKNEKIIGLESAWTSKDGTVVYIRESAKAIRDSNGKTLYYEGTVEDITERKRAEKEIVILAHSLRSVNESVIITDMEDKILFVNESLLKTYGYNENELNGKHISILRSLNNPPELVGEILPATLRVGWKGELWNKRKDGSEFQIYLSTTIINDKDGKLLGLIGVAQDITERKRAEEVLRESEDKFRSLVENISDVFYVSDQQGKFLYCSPNFFTISGYSPQDIYGNSFIRVIAPIDRRQVVDYYLEQTAKGSLDLMMEFRFIKKDGSIIWVEQNTRIVRDSNGKMVQFRNVARNITERKRAEEEIVMLAHSLRSVNECVSITDMEDKILFVNESFMKTYGYNLNELVGKHISIIRLLNSELALVKEILPATIHGGWKGELWNRRKDGSEFPISLSTTVINDKEGKPLGLIGVAQDITERKRAEEEISRMANILEATPDLVGMADLHGNVFYLNQGGKMLMGMPAYEEITKLKISDFHPDDIVQLIMREGLPTAAKKGFWSSETKLLSTAGEEIPVLQVILSHRNSNNINCLSLSVKLILLSL